MPIVKVIEVIASSEKGIEDAIQNALAEASKTSPATNRLHLQEQIQTDTVSPILQKSRTIPFRMRKHKMLATASRV